MSRRGGRVSMWSAMSQLNQPERLSPEGRTRAAQLARYLGADLAMRLTGQQPREQDLFLGIAQLTAARYAISTYLPRRLLAHQLGNGAGGLWLEWVEGSLLFADVSGSTALAERLGVLGREGTEIVTETL